MMGEIKTILLVDDERAIVKLLSIKLKISGFQVLTAFSGDEALEVFRSAAPDVMLLDIIMPGMDGFEVLRRLDGKRRVPVIACSASPGNAQLALSLGAAAFVPKPFDIDYLLAEINRVLDHQTP
jgi:DNA-binding response OmpR family regulator